GPTAGEGLMTRRSRDFPEGLEALPAPVVDNHTHLESIAPVLPDGVADPGTAGHLARAERVGVRAIVQIGCDLDSAPVSLEMAEEHPQVLAGVAIHPNEAVLHAGVREVAPDGLEPDPAPRHQVGLDEAIGQVAELARRTRGCGLWGRPVWTTSGPARPGARRSGSPSVPTSAWPRSSACRCRSTTGRRTARCSRCSPPTAPRK